MFSVYKIDIFNTCVKIRSSRNIFHKAFTYYFNIIFKIILLVIAFKTIKNIILFKIYLIIYSIIFQ